MKNMEDDDWIPESVLKKQKGEGDMEYCVKWKGYSAKHNSWIPSEELLELTNGPAVIEKFEKAEKQRNRLRLSSSVGKQAPTKIKELPFLPIDVWKTASDYMDNGTYKSNLHKLVYQPEYAQFVNDEILATHLERFSPEFLTHVTLASTFLTDDCLDLFLPFYGLEYLNIFKTQISISKLHDVIPKFKHLHTLCPPQNFTFDDISGLLSEFPNIKHVEYLKDDLIPEQYKDLITGAVRSNLYGLRQINFDNLTHLQYDTWATIPNEVWHLTNLQKLTLVSLNSSRAELSPNITNLKNLKELDTNYIFPYKALIQLLPQLEVLHLSIPMSYMTLKASGPLYSETMRDCTWPYSDPVQFPNCVRFSTSAYNFNLEGLPSLQVLEVEDKSYFTSVPAIPSLRGLIVGSPMTFTSFIQSYGKAGGSPKSPQKDKEKSHKLNLNYLEITGSISEWKSRNWQINAQLIPNSVRTLRIRSADVDEWFVRSFLTTPNLLGVENLFLPGAVDVGLVQKYILQLPNLHVFADANSVYQLKA